MKGIHGLILAIGLGIAGALFNYTYLASKLPETEMIGFVGIKPDVEVAPGEQLLEEHFVRVDVPRRYVGNLEDFLVPYSARKGAEGYRMWRPLPGGSLLLRQDLKTPPQELKLGPKEAITWIPVDTRSMVPSLINPGDQVSFLISTSRIGLPPPAEDEDLGSGSLEPVAGSGGSIETIGPFTVLSVGSRLGSPDVFKSARLSRGQEHVVGILVELDDNGDPLPHVRKLMELLDATGKRPAGVLLHGRGENIR